MRLKFLFVCLCLVGQIHAGGITNLHDIRVELQGNWKTTQEFKDEKTEFLLYQNGNDYVSLYVTSKEKMNFTQAKVLSIGTRTKSDVSWEEKLLLNNMVVGKKTVAMYTVVISTVIPPYQYVLTTTSENKATALKNSETFFEFVDMTNLRSLTGPEYKGKKYYLGFGDTLSGEMGNEVKYDIKHTHDIFTKEIGGSYIGTTFNGHYENGSDVKKEWARLKGLITADDMYVQYSSGHGSTTGLQFGLRYDEIRDNALSYPAKEMVIFLMACHAGGLVESFNNKKDVWKNFQAEGRTLFVMSSSTKSQTSSTGPEHDPDEPNGPAGSAGSAFGHALWKALIGYADGYIDGVKDGYISLEEIDKYATWKTQKVGGHTPQVTGAYAPKLIMNKVPPKAWLERLENGTEGLSDEEIMKKIQELDREIGFNR